MIVSTRRKICTGKFSWDMKLNLYRETELCNRAIKIYLTYLIKKTPDSPSYIKSSELKPQTLRRGTHTSHQWTGKHTQRPKSNPLFFLSLLSSVGVKKATQELYGLINFGELRKKIGGTLDERKAQKLQELIRKGSTSVRVKGKSVRVRTPICRALKKLNQIEGKACISSSLWSVLSPQTWSVFEVISFCVHPTLISSSC